MPRPGNSNHSTKRKLPVVAPEFKELTLEEIGERMTKKQFEFASEWINNGGNAVQAYRKAIWEKKPANAAWAKGKTATEVIQKINGSPQSYMQKPLVSAYLGKFEEERRAELAERNRFSYESWINNLDEISQEARGAEQYSPAIRAQELIGKAAGHIDSNRTDMATRMADTELSGKLADILGTTAETLSRALHGGSERSTDDAIDAEIVPDPALPGGSD